MQRSGYVAELEAEHSIESEGRIENLAELVGAARDFGSIDEFLEQISLVADTDQIDDDDSSVVLMTLHSAKGLEYPVVFLIGLEDGVFPHLRAIGEPDELEEERRLAYVGITRARERLYLTHAWAARSTAARSTTRRAGSSTRSPRLWSSRWRATAERPVAQPPRAPVATDRDRVATERAGVAPPAAMAATAGARPAAGPRTMTGPAR